MTQIVEETHARLMAFLEASGVEFRLLNHPACRTSAESATARAAAGAPGSVGAKALLLRVEGGSSFAMAVLPGTARLANDVVRRMLGKFRFATVGEIADMTSGLLPGMIPPFGAPFFPLVRHTFVDDQLAREPLIGFNAAMFERSVVMSGEDYLTIVPQAKITKLARVN